MANSNLIRVAFEVYTDQLQSRVKQAIGTITGLGNAGEEAGKKTKNGLNEAREGVEKLDQTVNNLVKLLTAGFVASKLKDLGLGIGRELVNGVKEGIEYNAQMEGYQSSFATMLGSEAEALELVNNLKKEATATPFGMQDLASAAQTLMSFGMSAEDAQLHMKQLGDISLGNADNFKSLTLAFAQMSSTGKLTGQDLMQMISAGFNPLEEISRRTGVSIGELKDAMSDGAISAELVAEAFASATSEGGRFYGAMASQSNTFSGQLATLQDGVAAFKGQMAEGLTGMLSASVLPKLNSWLDELSASFGRAGSEGGIFAAVGDKAKVVLENLFAKVDAFIAGGGLDMLMEMAGQAALAFLELLNALLNKIPAAFETAAGGAAWLAENFQELIELVKMGIETWLAFKSTMSVVSTAISIASNPILFVVGLIISAIVKLYMESEEARRVINIAFEGIKLTALAMARGFVGAFEAMATAVAFLTQAIPGVGEAVQGVTDKISGLAAGIDRQMANTVDRLDGLINKANAASAAVSKVASSSNGLPENEQYILGSGKKNTASSYKWPATFTSELSSGTSSGASGKTDNRTAFEKGMDNVEDAFSTREGLIDSQINLEAARGDDTAKKAFTQVYVDMLKEKLLSITGLDKLVASTDEKNILETAKNKILTQIEQTVQGMSGNVAALVGSFNTPSEFSTLTEYAYNTSNNSSLTRIISTPTMNMYLTVKDLGNSSAAEIRGKLDNFANAVSGKDGIVHEGMGNVLMNM